MYFTDTFFFDVFARIYIKSTVSVGTTKKYIAYIFLDAIFFSAYIVVAVFSAAISKKGIMNTSLSYKLSFT